MLSKRSENLLKPDALTGRRKAGITSSLRANLAVPFVLLAIYLLGQFLEGEDGVDRYVLRLITIVGFNLVFAVGLQLINGFSGQFSLGHAGFMAVGAYLAAYPARIYAHLGDSAAAARLIDHPFGALLFYASLGGVLVIGASVLYGFLQATKLSRRIWSPAPALLVLIGLGWIVGDISKASHYESPPAYFIWTHGIAALVSGFNGMMSTCAPAALHLSSLLPESLRQPCCYIVLVLGGGVFAAGAGFIVGIPTLRLRGDYLAIATLGLAEIIRITIQNSDPLGGALGLTQIPHYTNFAWLYGFAFLTVLVVWRIAYSPRGRLIQAVREDEIAASSIGINPTRQKVLAFVMGAFFGGVGGALFSLNEQSITPGYFGLQKSIEIVVIVTLGGLASISGAVVAAIILALLPELLRNLPGNASEYRMIIYALLLVLMMLLRPRGLLGGVELWPRRKTRRTANDIDPAKSSSAEKATLAVTQICRQFGGLSALNDFCLKISTGELVGLIGPNGAGKTTAFNVVTGVYSPTSGAVSLDDTRIDGLSPVWINRHGLARTFQNIRLFKELTVLDNVAAAFKNRRELSLWRTVLRTPAFFRERDRSEQDAFSLLAHMRLDDKAHQPAGSLPYGDQRRLEIARALATRPKVLLLDEPAAGMNPQEKSELMDLIRFVRDTFGVGVLLIEHDMKLVMSICQRITVLDHGETIAVGTPEEVRANPKVIEAYLGEPG